METLTKSQKTLSKSEKIIQDNPDVFKRISDIEIPDILFHPIKTGTPEFDKGFSELGGITPGSVYLITGTPGAGKTTLMATLGARLQTDKPIVFLSYEMSDFQLVLTARKIEGLDQFVVVTKEFHKDKKGFEDFLSGYLTNLDPGMIIVDSLQKMAGQMPGSFNKNQIWLTEMFTKFAKKNFVPVCMIGHVSKDGTYKGPSTILHEVDGQMHISIDKETGERMFQFGKNRFGGIFDPYIFRITGTGVYIGQEFWSQEGTDLLDMAIESVEDLREKSKDKDCVPFGAFRNTCATVVKYLEQAHQHELKSSSNVKDFIKITYVGARAFCSPSKGLLNFGPKFSKNFSDSKWKGIGYKREKEFMHSRVSDKVDAALWVIMHEFQHLFHGNHKHTKKFFRRIQNNWDRHADVLTAGK